MIPVTVLVQMEVSGLCHADLSALEGRFPGGKTRYLVVSPLIEIDSDGEASGSMDMDMLALRAGDSDWVVAATLRYADRYMRTEQGWKFAKRERRAMMP